MAVTTKVSGGASRMRRMGTWAHVVLLAALWLATGCAPQRPVVEKQVPGVPSAPPSTHEDATASGDGAIEIAQRFLGTVILHDPNLEQAVNKVWADRQPVTWYTPPHSKGIIRVTQHLSGGDSRVFWMQPALMWVDEQPFGSDAVQELWRMLSTKNITPDALKELIQKADTVTLTLASNAGGASAALTSGQRQELGSIFAASGPSVLEDDVYPDPIELSVPRYQIHVLREGREFVFELLGDVVWMTDLWEGSPLPIVPALG
ncbi:MAG: hypothetical protein ACYC5Y_06255 [Symbiobacteriia bacterium]